MSPLAEDLIYIAGKAAESIREKFGKSHEIVFKTNESNLVTEADKESEKIITDFVRQKYPHHGILAEESGGSNETAEYLWVIDPLDGTTNFAHGFPVFSVCIGVQHGGKTIAGVVHDVMAEKVYHAEAGGGAYCNGKPLRVSQTEALQRSLLVTGFPYDIADNPENALAIFVALVKQSRGMRRLGSAAIDFCYVASGVFDGFWEVHLNPWDICAGRLIAEEAGGVVTDFDGSDKDIYTKRVLCSNGKIHEQLVAAITNARGQQL